jgi:hypothetical protein
MLAAGRLQAPGIEVSAEVASNAFDILLDWATGLCGQQPWLQKLQVISREVVR